MHFYYKYSLGVYVNRHFASSGGEGNPHVFLGLKREKMKCNEGQIQMQKDVYQHYLKQNMPEQANQCKINIEQMQCFKQESTLEDLRKELSEKYQYTFANDKNFKAWQDVELDKTKANDKDFDETLRKEFNDNFTSLRQCYADITEPFFIWVKNIKNIDDDYLKTKMSFDKFETLFNEFIESQYSNLDSIEGFFGFGPYETKFFNNYKTDKYNTGGKVFQNNHWNDADIAKENKKPLSKNQIKKGKSLVIPRIPQDSQDKQYLTFSKDFTLTFLRPLKTFQEHQSEVMTISENQYKELGKSLLFQTLLSSYDIRHNQIIFGDTRNEFKNYKIVGNSCVSFVKDKLKIIFGNKLDWWDKMTWTPRGAYDVIKKHSKRFNTQELSITQSLLDIELFHQNYATLCSIDSSWECEKGLNAFILHYANLITLDNYIFPLTFNKEHAKALGDTKHIRENQIPFAFEKELLNIKQEYTNYQQDCSINRDTPLAFNDFKLQLNQDDLARRINTGTYIANELEYLKQKIYEDSKISLLTFHHKEERFHIANADNDFSYKDFDLSNIDSTASIAGYASSIKRASLIIADNIKYDGNITQESMRAYINVMVAKASGKFGNSHNTISLAKAYYTQQEKYNA